MTAVEKVIKAAQSGEPTITQDGLARAFADVYAGRLRYCHSTCCWYEWTGTRWKRDEVKHAFELVRQLAREQSTGLKDGELASLRRTSFAAGVERFAQGDPALAVTAEKWDTDPYLLGTPGGAVDLRTGTLRAARPEEGITKLTQVAPSETADCPIWLAFLITATGGDPGMIRLLQLWCGYSLTGDTSEHALVFICGPGGNGKSTFLDTVTSIFGDYAATASMDTFTVTKGDRHPADMAMLRGARLVAASETEEGRPWAESRIKQMTGGDLITARFMRGDFFTYRPSFKLTMSGNHHPALQNVDDAMKRRVNIIPFTQQPPTIDLHLKEKLKAEAPGILRWMIDGCEEWQLTGLVRPDSVKSATAEYFEDQDVIGHWLEARCIVEPGNELLWTSTTALFASWKVFAEAAGQKPGTTKAFSTNLERRRLRKHRFGDRGRGFYGISFR